VRLGFEYTLVEDGKEAVTTIRLSMGDSLEQARIRWIEGIECKVDWVVGRDKERQSADRTVNVCRYVKAGDSCGAIVSN